jgi:hypothetical protein
MSALGQKRTFRNVRFTPESGHCRALRGLPLCATHTLVSGTSPSTTAIPLAYPKQLSDREILAEHDPSIIGATQKRWHRLSRVILRFSVTVHFSSQRGAPLRRSFATI